MMSDRRKRVNDAAVQFPIAETHRPSPFLNPQLVTVNEASYDLSSRFAP